MMRFNRNSQGEIGRYSKLTFLVLWFLISLLANIYFIFDQSDRENQIKEQSIANTAKNFSEIISLPLKIGDNFSVIKNSSIFAKLLPEGAVRIKGLSDLDPVVDVNPNNIDIYNCFDQKKSIPVFYEAEKVGYLEFCYKREDGSLFLDIRYIMLISFLIGVVFFLAYRYYNNRILFIDQTIRALEKYDGKGAEQVLDCTNHLLSKLNNIFDEKYKLEKEKDKNKHLLEINKVATQVAHDIRSPLAALEMISTYSDGLPHEQRSILQSATRRIHDIANNLLSKNKEVMEKKESGTDIYMLYGLIDPIITEKRIQFRDKKDLIIISEISDKSYGAFVNVNETQFKRVISNLINNSVEALKSKGKVLVTQEIDGDWVNIQITDNGPGIPPEIVPKIMNSGVSYAKENGSGIGLHHAKENVEKWGGLISIESDIGIGTTVSICLKLYPAPIWFKSNLKLNKASNLVIVDDDESIHQLWKQSLINSGINLSDISLHDFYEFDSLKDWKEINQKDSLYLIDYEFIGANETGLDLIKELNLENHSILVTSHYEDYEVKNDCIESGIPIIPKNLISYLMIFLSN